MLWARRAAVVLAVAAIPLAGAAFMLLPGPAPRPQAITAVFTAPTLVLRAAVAGRIVSVDAIDGAAVQPDSALLTIHTAPPPDPAAAALHARLAVARARVESFDAQIAQAVVPTKGAAAIETARARQVDNARLRANAAAERDQIQQSVATAAPTALADLVIRARLRGYVRSVEATAGTETVAGAPLAQLIDCDRAFLVPREGATRLHAGDPVRLQIQGVPPFDGAVRLSSGISEPPGSLVIDPSGLKAAAPGACPLGAAAVVLSAPAPEAIGSSHGA